MRFDPHPSTPLVIGSGDNRETSKAALNIVCRSLQLINEPISRAPCPGKNKRGTAARATMSRHPNRKKSKAKKKKYKDTDAHGTRPKLIRQCRSFAAPALVVAAQFPKE
jgi:hypothetical protein